MPKTQLEIAGTEAPTIPEIEQAAEKYIDARDKRMALTKKEVAAKQALIDVTKANSKDLDKDENGNLHYRFGDDLEVVLKKGKDQVKVGHVVEDDEEG